MVRTKATFKIILLLITAFILILLSSGCRQQGKNNPNGAAKHTASSEKKSKDPFIKYKQARGAIKPSAEDCQPSTLITPIKNPRPTHLECEAPLTELEKTIDISADIDNEHFMVSPRYITADDKGNIYVMDRNLKMIFKFSKTGDYIASFGEAGVGPGQLGDQNSQNEIHSARDGSLCVSDPRLQRLTRFSSSGKLLSDFRINLRGNIHVDFSPIISPEGEIFIRTGIDSTLDVYKISGNTAGFQYQLLGKEFFTKTIHFHIRKIDETYYSMTDYYSLSSHPAPNGRLMAYIHPTSELIIFKRDILEKKFRLWPDRMLANYLKYGDYKHGFGHLSELRESDIAFKPIMFFSSFFDGDDDSHVYLSDAAPPPYKKELDKPKEIIYKFDMEGKLVERFFTKIPVFLKCKKNNLFYGISYNHEQIFIFRPKNKTRS